MNIAPAFSLHLKTEYLIILNKINKLQYYPEQEYIYPGTLDEPGCTQFRYGY